MKYTIVLLTEFWNPVFVFEHEGQGAMNCRNLGTLSDSHEKVDLKLGNFLLHDFDPWRALLKSVLK